MPGMTAGRAASALRRSAGIARILVVDDNAGNRLAVRRALAGLDVEVHEAASGFDALSLSLATAYAVVLLDVQMPDMDGFEVCAHLRANPDTADMPVILMTAAFTAAEDVVSGYAEGATDYLMKPFNDHILRAKVQVFLRLWRQHGAMLGAIEAANRAREEAERACLARSKFLAAASHDLRQPVQSLTLLLEAVKAHVDAPKVVNAVAAMEGALAGLNCLLVSVLDLSRLDAGVVMPQIQPVDMGDMLLRLSQEYAVSAAAKGLHIRTFLRPLHGGTDPALMERVIRNLIENAIRYTSKGGILIALRHRSGQLRVDVIDTGIGIPAGQQGHIFEEFYQVGNPGRDRAQGLGLGLSIVARIVRLLGAEVEVVSREQRGTRFSILLPVARLKCGPSPAAPAVLHDESGRVLVIEDDVWVRSGLQMMIEGWGYEVTAVASGEEALDLICEKSSGFDAVIADHRLGPGLTGTAAAREIQMRIGRPLPTLIVTGDTDPARIADVHASGFDMLHKPVAAGDLRRKLAKLVQAHAGRP